MAPPRPRLAARRKALGYSQERLALELEVTPSTVASWEQGTSTPRPRRKERMAETLNLTRAELNHILDAAEPTSNGDGTVAEWVGLLAGMEQGAAQMQTYEPLVIPALLQTSDYSAAVEANHWRQVTEEAAAKRAANRVARQRVLDREPNPLQLTAIIDEAALLRRLGTSATMTAQLDHLAAMAERPTIDIRITALLHGQHGAAVGPFRLLTNPGAVGPHVACVATLSGMVYHESTEQVLSHAELFRFLLGRSLGAAESLELIRRTSTDTWKRE